MNSRFSMRQIPPGIFHPSTLSEPVVHAVKRLSFEIGLVNQDVLAGRPPLPVQDIFLSYYEHTFENRSFSQGSLNYAFSEQNLIYCLLLAQVGTQSDIRDQRYRTEPDIGTSDIGLKSAESDIISDIGRNFSPISDFNI